MKSEDIAAQTSPQWFNPDPAIKVKYSKDDEEREDIFCPIQMLSVALLCLGKQRLNGEDIRAASICDKEKCAWWDIHWKNCGVLTHFTKGSNI